MRYFLVILFIAFGASAQIPSSMLDDDLLVALPKGPSTTCTLLFDTGTSWGTYNDLGSTTDNYYYGQKDISFPSATNICKIEFMLRARASAPNTVTTNTFTAKIWTTNSAALGTLVGTSQGVTGDDSWNQTLVTFTFSPPVSLNASQYYDFTCDQGVISSTSYCWIYAKLSSSIPGNTGRWAYSKANDNTFPTWDTIMKIHTMQ